VVIKTLEKDRNQRYSSLKEVLEDIKKGYETANRQDANKK
jgi:hypothetical protein